ncbi:ATPase/GTPase, AAA15 family [Dyadobacter koreensis]|uniref:ATPase/GTPase, AAA15 family n=1 Tax=Dyadobacter koreensis TaxID=408657 RepID=A0A1H6XYZ9_9BACT|nr:ATP-binding protein [Dyadobacter koreensis]SEJ34298.1 ATPase/GTPase, AAA15 family [Dyadobacter koreensis]
MIHYLKIRNFGAIKEEAEINFEVAEGVEEDAYEQVMADGRKLLKLAYIYGANASGKTTFLQAFEFLRKLLLKPIENKAGELAFDPFLFCEQAYKKHSYMEMSFYKEGLRYVYSVNFNKQSVLDERLVFYQTVRPTELFTRETDLEKRLAKIQFGSRIKIPAREKDLLEGNTLHNNTVLGAYAKTNADIPELEELNKWLNTYFLGLITSANNLTEVTAQLIDRNPGINSWINDFLNKADRQIMSVQVPESNDQIGMPLEDAFHNEFKNSILGTDRKFASSAGVAGITNVKYYGGPSERRIEFIHQVGKEDRYALSIQKESSGTKRYFGLGGPLYELIHGSHIVCIDELETSLHPDLMKHFLQVFLMNSTYSQLLITTHNFSLMADQDFIRRDALWFSEKAVDGSVSLFAASDFDTTTLRKEANLINAYKAGRLGAKPNLGSPYITQ